MRLVITTSLWRAGSPSGQPAIARMCCSNCEHSAGSHGPVAGIVHARRDLVDEQPPSPSDEHLDAEDADIVERSAIARGDRRRPRRRRRRRCRRARVDASQDVVLVLVLGASIGARSRRRGRARRSPKSRARRGRALEDQRLARRSRARRRPSVVAGADQRWPLPS